MAHIIIIGQTIEILGHLDEYHEQISEAITNGEYDEDQQRLANAQALISSTDSMLSAHKTALDGKVAEMETFLGI